MSSKSISQKEIESCIYHVRGVQVMLDYDLANIYQVETRALNQAVKRNIERFPADFMFQLDQSEWENLKSHFVISTQHGGRRTVPFAFTEQGVSGLSGVLKSEKKKKKRQNQSNQPKKLNKAKIKEKNWEFAFYVFFLIGCL